MRVLPSSRAEKPYGVLILVLSLIFLGGMVGCGGASGGPSESVTGAGTPAIVPPPGPVLLSVSVKTGRDFECLVTGSLVRCRATGPGSHPDLGIGTANFVASFSSNSDIVELVVFEDSLCFSTVVDERPISRTPGLASYCFGEVSGGMPGFDQATQGTGSLAGGTPFSADDGALSGLTSLILDNPGSERDEECDGVTNPEYLTCETFEVDL